jgi:hypothetical protein
MGGTVTGETVIGAILTGSGVWIRTLFPSWLARLGVTFVIGGTECPKPAVFAGGAESVGGGATLRMNGAGGANVGATTGGAALGEGAGALPRWLGLPALWAGEPGLGLEWATAAWCSAAHAGEAQIAVVNVTAAQTRFVVSDMACDPCNNSNGVRSQQSSDAGGGEPVPVPFCKRKSALLEAHDSRIVCTELAPVKFACRPTGSTGLVC